MRIRPPRDVEKARDQIRQRGLSRPARTHDGHHFAPGDAEIDVLEERHAVFVFEIHVVENDLLLERRQVDGARLLHHLRAQIQELEDLLGCPDGLLEGVVDAGQPLDRAHTS